MRRIQRPASISFSHLPVQNGALPGRKGKLKKVQSQSILPHDVPPMTQLGKDFQSEMTDVSDVIRTLFVSQTTLKKLEQLCEECMAAGLKVTESGDSVEPEEFFRVWDTLGKEVSECFRENVLVRSQEYFRSEVAAIKSAIRTFTGPRDRMTITSEITALETQLNMFRASEKRIPIVRRIIDNLVRYFSSFPSSNSPSHVELLRVAELKLGRLSESLDEYVSQEPHANEVIDRIESAGRRFDEMFARQAKVVRRRSMPNKQPLLQATKRIARNPVPRLAIVQPRESTESIRQQLERIRNEIREMDGQIQAGAELAERKGELEQEIAEQRRLIANLNAQLKMCATKMVRNDLLRIYADYNKQVEELNGRSTVILNAVEALVATGEESQTVVFSNTQLHNEAQFTLREVTKFRNELQFLEKQRNNHVYVNEKRKAPDEERYMRCHQFLVLENADIEDDIRLLSRAVEDEERFQATIQKCGQSKPNEFVESQIDRLRSETRALDAMIASSTVTEKIPPIVEITDRSTFDEEQTVYDRMKEIQLEYHGDVPVSPQRAKALEKEFSNLESQIPDWQDTYEALNNLNLQLNDAREVYSQNMEEAALAQQELIDIIGNKEVLEGEMSLAVAETPTFRYNRKKAKECVACFKERIEIARQLKLVDDFIDEFSDNHDGATLLDKVQMLRERLVQ